MAVMSDLEIIGYYGVEFLTDFAAWLIISPLFYLVGLGILAFAVGMFRKLVA